MARERFSVSAGVMLALLATGGMLWGQRGTRGGGTESSAMEFRAIGPALGGGRVCCVVGVPGRPGIYYVGSAGGGVWKTTDGGFHWTSLFDHGSTGSIGAVALAPSNPNLVWVGTGESNVRNDVIDGHGLFFSPDGGQTFSEVGKQYFHDAGQIAKIIINPKNPEEVWVAVLGHAFGPNTNRGVFRTTDGGTTWQKTLFVNDSTGTIDLAMQPDNPRVLVAAMWQTVRHPWGLEDGGPGSGIYKSTDGGVTWHEIAGHGLPAQPYGRIAVEFAPSEPERLYAEIQAKRGVFWRSDDAGENWTMVSDNDQLNSRPFYFSRFAVMPNNPDGIYFLSVGMSYSSDGGKTAQRAGTSLHADHHSLWMDPTNPKRMIEGDDGGVNFSHDGGQNWVHVTNLPIEEGYSIHVDSEQPYHICVGLQDNDGFCGPSRAEARPADWRDFVSNSDGEYVVPAPSDPNIIYAEAQEGDAQRFDLKTGEATSIKPMPNGTSGESAYVYNMPARFNWTTPIEVSAANANVVYMGANRLYKSTDGGFSWDAISPDLTLNDKSKQQPSGGVVALDMTGAETADTILSIGLSRLDPNTIWIGTDDGIVQVTQDGGKTWSRVSDNIQGLKPWGRLQEMEVSPFDPDTAYIAYDRHEMNDWHPYVYKTHDSGKTWTEIDAGLPDDYVSHAIREDPNHKGLLVLGTDNALYRSANDGASWTRIQDGFPTAAVYDIKFVKRTHSLLVCTHGRGIYILDNITPWEQMATPAVAAAPFTLFPILNAVMFERSGLGTLSRDPLARRQPQPPEGAVIQYNLAAAVHTRRGATATPTQSAEQQQAAAMAAEFGFRIPNGNRGPVTIAIADAEGHPIATLHGSGHAGINQAVWGGTYDPSPVQPPSRGRRGFFSFFRGGGLRALPGRYQVTVTVPGLAPQRQWVNLEEDPRIPVNLAARKAALAAGQAMQADVDAMNRMLNGLDSLDQQLGAAQKNLQPLSGPNDYGNLLHQAQTLQKKVTMLEQVLTPPPAHEDYGRIGGFASDFNGIFREISGGTTQMPRPQDLRDWASARQKLAGYLDRYNQLLTQDVAAFNRQALADHGVTLIAGQPVTLGRRPTVLAAAAASATKD